MGQCHQMPNGGGRGVAKLSRGIFSKIINHTFVFWPPVLKEFG